MIFKKENKKPQVILSFKFKNKIPKRRQKELIKIIEKHLVNNVDSFIEGKTIIEEADLLTDLQKYQYNKLINDIKHKKITNGDKSINRIQEVLDLLEIIWYKNSNLRLGQIILNVIKEDELYYLEDNQLYNKLKNHYIGNDRSLKL